MNIEKHVRQFSVRELFEFANLECMPLYLEMDYAIPINANGTYPFGGKAISIYRKDFRLFIVSHGCLMVAAHENILRILNRPENYMRETQGSLYKKIQFCHMAMDYFLKTQDSVDDYIAEYHELIDAFKRV
jgi:hypothetical protein